MKEKYKVIHDIMENELSCSAHSIDHVMRVYSNCIKIAKCEKGVDLDVLCLSALLHDIARVKESTDTTGKTDHALLGAQMAADILTKEGYDQEFISKVEHCIKTHRYRSGGAPKSIEAKILFDSDKLDVIGAVGIARSFMLAGQFGQSLSKEHYNKEYIEENTTENGRLKDVSKHSPMLEYEFKFKKVPDKMHTEKGRELAVEKLKVMERFFKELREEISD